MTPQYLDAEERYKQAATPEARLQALEEMAALIPKHKGTEKLQAEIRKKVSQAKKDQEKKRPAARHDPSVIPREGAGRVVLLGPPNSGKSSLLGALTNAEPEVAPYPFTTRLPELGMAPWKDIQFQFVDLPAVSREFMEPWVFAVARTADLALILADHSAPSVLEDVEETEKILQEHKIYTSPPSDDEFVRGAVAVPSILVVNKVDLPGGPENAAVVADVFGGRYQTLSVSSEMSLGLEELMDLVFKKMQIVRVYSKAPGKPADMQSPYTLRVGSTLPDFCGMVHKDFAENLKFARIWGAEKFDGQRVNRDYELCDGDVVELHI